MSISRIDIKKDRIPYKFNIELTNYKELKTYTFTVKYNDVNDYFTIDIEDSEGVIIYGVKLTYGTPIFNHLTLTKLPDEILIPLDPNEQTTVITFDNFNESVYIYVFDPEVFI